MSINFFSRHAYKILSIQKIKLRIGGLQEKKFGKINFNSSARVDNVPTLGQYGYIDISVMNN